MQDKIQKLELDTVKAVTELKGEVKALTKEVSNLSSSITKMTENYITREEHGKDIQELRTNIKSAKRVGVVRSVLVGILSAVMTALITYEALKITN